MRRKRFCWKNYAHKAPPFANNKDTIICKKGVLTSMKATGVVRRIDNLGRIVIPKEIRRTLHIREGDPLEIYTDVGGQVIFKKYSPLGEMGELAERFAAALALKTDFGVLICDRERCIAAAGANRSQMLDHAISNETAAALENRRLFVKKKDAPAAPALENCTAEAALIVPIITAGDLAGGVILVCGTDGPVPDEADSKLAQVAAEFFSRNVEN